MLCSLMGTESRLLCNQMPYSHAVERGQCPSTVANEAVLDCRLTEVLEKKSTQGVNIYSFQLSLRNSVSNVAVNLF